MRLAASKSLLMLFCLLGTCAAVFAQNPRGTLRGSVQDASGGRIAGAKISARNRELSVLRQTESDARGEFRFEDLPPAWYSLTVTASQFADFRADVRIAVSSVREISLTLRNRAVAEKVVVNADAQSITSEYLDTASAVHQAIIYRQDLETIPLAARSFANIAYLAPGTEPVEPSDPTKARITAVGTGGSSGLNNEVSVDGADNSDDYIGGFLQNFSPDAIEEFAFRTAQADADTGRTTAGSVVITTRSGTNTWHGDFSFYERAAGLNARFPIDNPAPNPKQPFSRQNYVGAIGGPMVKDRLWFFTSLEYVHENASIAYSNASTAQFEALAQLASMGLIPGVTDILVAHNVPVPFRDYLAATRLDWAQSEWSRWFLRGAIDTYTMRNALVQQGALPSTGATSHNNYVSLVLGQQYAFSPQWLGSLVVDFSGPAGLAEALTYCEARGVALVTGTTGLDATFAQRLNASAQRIALLRSANFSLGVAVLTRLLRQAAAALPGWDLDIVEAHHSRKEDAPSGTALALGEAAQAHGLSSLPGSSPDVGVIGFTLGGGLSWLGRRYGRAIVERYAHWLLKPGRLMVAESFVRRYGALAVCLARFVGGFRPAACRRRAGGKSATDCVEVFWFRHRPAPTKDSSRRLRQCGRHLEGRHRAVPRRDRNVHFDGQLTDGGDSETYRNSSKTGVKAPYAGPA